MGGLKIPEPPDTAFLAIRERNVSSFPTPMAEMIPAPVMAIRANTYFAWLAWIYSAIVLTDLKTSLPSAGFFNLMP